MSANVLFRLAVMGRPLCGAVPNDWPVILPLSPRPAAAGPVFLSRLAPVRMGPRREAEANWWPVVTIPS